MTSRREAGTQQPAFTACLLGASYTTANRGVAALASGTVNSVMSGRPGARVFFFDYNRQPDVRRVQYSGGTTDIELVNVRFSKRIWQANHIGRLLAVALIMRLLPLAPIRRWLLDRHPHLRRMNDADVVLSIGGGDSFADVYGLARLVYVSLPQLLAIVLGRPLVQLPQTIGPFDGTVARAIARFILKRSARVYARDTESLQAAKHLAGDGAHVEFAFDMAFGLRPSQPHQREAEWLSAGGSATLIGLNLSGLLYVGGYSRDNMFGLKDDYRHVVQALLASFLARPDCRIVLIPHVYAPGDTSESDTIACEAVVAEWKERYKDRLHYVSSDHDESEIKALIGRCDFIIGSRMHACIAALSQCVPAVGLAYSRKFSGLWLSVGVPELVLDLRDLTSDDVLVRVNHLLDARRDLRRRLEATIPDACASTLRLFSDASSGCSRDSSEIFADRATISERG